MYDIVSAGAYIGGFHRFLNFCCSWLVWFWVRKYYGLKTVVAVKTQLVANNEGYNQNTKDRLLFISSRSFHIKYYFSQIFSCKCFKSCKDRQFLLHERFVKEELKHIHKSLTLPRYIENNENLILLNMKLQRDIQNIQVDNITYDKRDKDFIQHMLK